MWDSLFGSTSSKFFGLRCSTGSVPAVFGQSSRTMNSPLPSRMWLSGRGAVFISRSCNSAYPARRSSHIVRRSRIGRPAASRMLAQIEVQPVTAGNGPGRYQTCRRLIEKAGVKS